MSAAEVALRILGGKIAASIANGTSIVAGMAAAPAMVHVTVMSDGLGVPVCNASLDSVGKTALLFARRKTHVIATGIVMLSEIVIATIPSQAILA